MVKSLATTISTISLVIAVLCMVAMGYGRAVAAPDDVRADSFAMCGYQPCFLGMTPGVTAWKEAQSAFASYALVISEKRIVFHIQPAGNIALYKSVNDKTVGRIYLTLKTPLAVGWIIESFGFPCGISLQPNSTMATLRYPTLQAIVRLSGAHLDLRTPVTSVQFYDPDYQPESQPNMCVDSITRTSTANRMWQGFAPVWHYLTHS
jgi:hypothetical protein